MMKVLEEAKGPISLEELSVNTLSRWGRNFPPGPYHPVALTYKLAARYLNVEVVYEDASCPMMVPRGISGAVSSPLSPDMTPEELNRVVEDLKRVKVRLKS